MPCSSLLGAHRVPSLLPPLGTHLPVSPTSHHYNFPHPNVPSHHKSPHVSLLLTSGIPPCPSPHITVTPHVPPSPPQAPCAPIPITVRIPQCSLIITVHPPVPMIVIAIPYHCVGAPGS